MSGTQTNENKVRAATDVPAISVSVPIDNIGLELGSNVEEQQAAQDTASDFLDVNETDSQSAMTSDGDEDVDLSMLEGPSSDSSDDQEELEEGFLEIDSEKCLTCKSLIPFMTKTYKSCHFTAGNKNCPAAATKIIVKIPLDLIVPKFLSAERNGDFSRLAKLSAVLGDKPDWYQQRVKDALDQERRNSN